MVLAEGQESRDIFSQDVPWDACHEEAREQEWDRELLLLRAEVGRENVMASIVL